MTASPATPPARTSLRSKQKEMARHLILQAAADEIVEHGIEGLSLQAVADRAGVAKRTLYNHFDSRDTLFTAMTRRSDELTVELGGALAPDGLESLDQLVPALWRAWEELGTVYDAAIALEAAVISDTGIPAARQRRRAAFIESVHRVRPDLPDTDVHDVAALIHALCGGPLYERLVKEDGLPVERGIELVTWVVSLVRAALEDVTTPINPPATPAAVRTPEAAETAETGAMP